MRQDKPNAFRFLDLPTEIRNRIYEYVEACAPLQGPILPSICQHHNVRLAVQPKVTKVSRQLRNEAIPIFYASNKFEVHIHRCDFQFFFDWMDKIGFDNRKHLRNVSVHLMDRWVCGEALVHLVRWRAKTTGLENLSFNANVNAWNTYNLQKRTRRDVQRKWLPMAETVAMFNGAIEVGKKLSDKRDVSEARIRYDWQNWLRLNGGTCKIVDCEQSRIDVDYRASPRSFNGYCTTVCSMVRYNDTLVGRCNFKKEKYSKELKVPEILGYDEEPDYCDQCGQYVD